MRWLCICVVLAAESFAEVPKEAALPVPAALNDAGQQARSFAMGGAYRGIGVPKGTPAAERKRLSDLWRAMNNDPEMKELAAKSGFELVNVGLEEMDAFMNEKVKLYTEGAALLGMGAKK